MQPPPLKNDDYNKDDGAKSLCRAAFYMKQAVRSAYISCFHWAVTFSSQHFMVVRANILLINASWQVQRVGGNSKLDKMGGGASLGSRKVPSKGALWHSRLHLQVSFFLLKKSLPGFVPKASGSHWAQGSVHSARTNSAGKRSHMGRGAAVLSVLSVQKPVLNRNYESSLQLDYEEHFWNTDKKIKGTNKWSWPKRVKQTLTLMFWCARVCAFVYLSSQTPRSSSESPLMKKSPTLASLVANKKGGRRLRIDLKKGAAVRLSHVAACSSVVVWSCSGRAVGGRGDGRWRCGEVEDVIFSQQAVHIWTSQNKMEGT